MNELKMAAAVFVAAFLGCMSGTCLGFLITVIISMAMR